MAEGIVVGGLVAPLLHPITGFPIPVFGPDDHGMRFTESDGHNRARDPEIALDLGVFHWTGSENYVETMFRVLMRRKLGVTFAITPYGSLYQFCDPTKVTTAHAGRVNDRCWGVEIVSAGVRRAGTLWREPRYRKAKMGRRDSYYTKIHGRRVHCYDFYPAQKMTALALNKAMVEYLPDYPSEVCVRQSVIEDIDGLEEENERIRGAVGHFQVSRRKIDPATRLMYELDAYMKDGTLPSDLRETV